MVNIKSPILVFEPLLHALICNFKLHGVIAYRVIFRTPDRMVDLNGLPYVNRMPGCLFYIITLLMWSFVPQLFYIQAPSNSVCS